MEIFCTNGEADGEAFQTLSEPRKSLTPAFH